jgi:hypothetical protein
MTNKNNSPKTEPKNKIVCYCPIHGALTQKDIRVQVIFDKPKPKKEKPFSDNKSCIR